MSIRFQCERCGHPIDVDDRLGGKHGQCKHCGHRLVVPGGEGPAAAGPAGVGPRLRPLEGEEPTGVAGHLLAAPAPLTVRPAEADPRPRPAAISDPDGPRPGRGGKDEDYSVLDPHRLTERHSSAGPPPFWTLLPTMTARMLAGDFRRLRDGLYVASLAFLVAVLLGYLFQVKLMLHLGAVGVVATNIGMLCAGAAYLLTLPFKEGLGYGLANLLVPFYAPYYWATRWPKMKNPVVKTLNAFVPIALVGLAYLVYEEAPAVEQAIERELPKVEQALDRGAPALEKKVDDALAPLEQELPPLRAPTPAATDSPPP